MSLAVAPPAAPNVLEHRPVTPLFRWLIIVLLALGAGLAGVAAAPAASAASGRLTTFDNRMLELVNNARTNAGLPKVQSATGLVNLSVYWSTQMANNATGNVLQHNPNAFQQTLTYGASNRTAWAENVAKWSPASVSADSVFDKYMSSAGHKANILGANYRYIGIGSVTGDNGASWDTMTFTDKVDPGQVAVPIGYVDSVAITAGTVRTTGWTFDTAASSVSNQVHVYVNGVGYANVANGTRADVNAAYGITGAHGFDISVPAVYGANQICVYSISTVGSDNSTLYCITLNYAPSAPRGVLDSVTLSGGNLQFAGWSYDDSATGNSNPIHVYINGSFATGLTANGSRPDVNAAYGIGANHGFIGSVQAVSGSNQVCVYALSTVGVGNSQLGCVTVNNTTVPTIGYLDSMSRSGGTVTVSGWAFDPHASSTSIGVHVYANSVGNAIATNAYRGDVNAAYGISGNHGFSATVNAPSGANVCLYAISASGGASSQFVCRTV